MPTPQRIRHGSPSTHRIPIRHRTLLAWLAAFFAAPLLLTAAAPAAARGVSPETPPFQISAFNLGTNDQIPPTMEGVVETLNQSEWCKASPHVSRLEWDELPAGADPARWLSVVALGFGKQADAYVFQFQTDGTTRLLAHFPYRKRLSQGTERWFSPTPQLLGVLQSTLTRAARPPGVPLQLEILEAAGPFPGEDPGVEEALQLPPRAVLPPVKALLTAAACSEGWAPTRKPAPHRAKVEVRVHDQACSFRLTFEDNGKPTVFLKERIPWEEFHDQLCVLLRMPRLSPKVVDFIRPNPRSVEMLEAEGNRFFQLSEGELVAMDSNAQEVWRLRSLKGKTPLAAKKPDFFTTRRDEQGRLHLFAWSPGGALAEIAAADGKTSALAPEAPAGANPTFDVDASGTVALAREGRVALFANGKEVWSVSEASAVSCGPRLEGERILLGNENGELVALARADGKPLWRVEGGAQLWGRIVPVQALRLAFSNGSETLLAFDPATGKIQWQFAAGDALVQAPFLHEGALVVATKNNRLLRLDPQSGVPKAETTLPGWIKDVRPVALGNRHLLALSEAAGRLSLLGPDLKPLWEASSGARLTGSTVLAQLRPQWKSVKRAAKGSSEDLLENLSAETDGLQPFLLCSDAEGFLYKIALRALPQ